MPVAPPPESLHVPIPGATLHVRRFPAVGGSGPPALLLHGSIEDGRIFWSASGKGLAPYLASRGFDVFVPDLRGRGRSTPPTGRGTPGGLHEAICEELPAVLDRVRELTGDLPRLWAGHSSGGFIVHAHLARFPESCARAAALVGFGSRRILTVASFEQHVHIGLGYRGVGPWLALACGYLPVRALGVGPQDESRGVHADTCRWIASEDWLDPVDSFDYGRACREAVLPPTLHLVGSEDRCFATEADVRRFVAELGNDRAEVRILDGFGHNDMLTSRRAPEAHFGQVADWAQAALAAHPPKAPMELG